MIEITVDKTKIRGGYMNDFYEEGVLEFKGQGIQDGKAMIQVDMHPTNFTDVTILSANVDAYEVQQKLALLIREMEAKADGPEPESLEDWDGVRLLDQLIKVVEWHVHNRFSRDTSPQISEKIREVRALRKELERRLK